MHASRVLDATGPSYPGERASVPEMLALADAYGAAARCLLAAKPKKIERAPAHCCAMQAIELYLNACLRHCGRGIGEVRGFQHDLGAMLDCGARHGLAVDDRTQAHLRHLVIEREFLIARYAPDQSSSLSPQTRLEATLKEVERAVRAVIRTKPAKALPSTPVTQSPTPQPPMPMTAQVQVPPAVRSESSLFTGVVLGPGGELFELKLNPIRR